jgi:3-isopropylmalate/(R)-2-methylmalate dehydratase small subunit
MILGKAHKFRDNIDTDAIIPARYLNTHDPAELAKHVMEDADQHFAEKMKVNDIIVAGENFGCGSSREHAPIAIKAAGISAVIAKSFARIFYRNAINIGLPILESKEAAEGIADGDEVEIELTIGEIRNVSTKKNYKAAAFPPFMQQIIKAGGLIEYVRKKIHGKNI